VLSQTFTLGEQLADDESRTLEFKEVLGGNPTRSIADVASSYATAFLNSEGGRVLWGVADRTRTVKGVRLGNVDRDHLARLITGRLAEITPAVDPSQFRVSFHPVVGVADEVPLYVVELTVPSGRSDQTYCTRDGKFIVRLDGANQTLSGLRLADWIRGRQSAMHLPDVGDNHASLVALASRVRRVFEDHGVEPAHIARFMEQRRAPFTLGLSDLRSNETLIRWINDERLDWLAATFHIRREWLDGEDPQIHERLHFDKQPKEFFDFASRLLTESPAEFSDLDYRAAYFVRCGKGRKWMDAGLGEVVVVLATPIAFLNSERVVCRYASDLTPYPWDYQRTRIQLRAWARLLFVELGFQCWGMQSGLDTCELLQANSEFSCGR
jgi:hypothetical protein